MILRVNAVLPDFFSHCFLFPLISPSSFRVPLRFTIFLEVPVVEYPVPPVLVAVATEKVEVTNVTLNASFVQPLKTSPVVYSTVYYTMRFSQNTSVIEGEDLWVINFFVSKTNDGTKSKVNIASYRQTSGTSKIEPGGELTFTFFAK